MGLFGSSNFHGSLFCLHVGSLVDRAHQSALQTGRSLNHGLNSPHLDHRATLTMPCRVVWRSTHVECKACLLSSMHDLQAGKPFDLRPLHASTKQPGQAPFASVEATRHTQPGPPPTPSGCGSSSTQTKRLRCCLLPSSQKHALDKRRCAFAPLTPMCVLLPPIVTVRSQSCGQHLCSWL